jgi:hypothetical protein
MINTPEKDFLEGRVSTTVFITDYFNPTWISILKKALKNENQLLLITSLKAS